MDPRNALSPKGRLQADTLEVSFTSKDGSWSLAKMVWDEHPVVGMRWNGEISSPSDLGNPTSHGQATWFILPNEIGRPLVELLQATGEIYDLDALNEPPR